MRGFKDKSSAPLCCRGWQPSKEAKIQLKMPTKNGLQLRVENKELVEALKSWYKKSTTDTDDDGQEGQEDKSTTDADAVGHGQEGAKDKSTADPDVGKEGEEAEKLARTLI